MPWKPRLVTLKRACLENVAKHMDDIWCKDYIDNLLDQGTFIHIISPFQYLPPSLTEALLYVLVDLSILKRHHLHVLIDPRLKRLDLGKCKVVANNNSIVKLTMERCQNLTHLSLAGCNQVSARMLCELFQKITRIVSLDLSNTKSTDQVCAIIGHYCRQLEELKLSNCPITDMGVISLCVTFSSDEPTKVPLLAVLDLSETSSVGLKAVKAALTSLPQLKQLSHVLVGTAIGELHSEDYVDGTVVPHESQYKLQGMDVYVPGTQTAPELYESYIDIACAYCPLVREVRLICSASNKAITSLGKLAHLHSLSLLDDMPTAGFEQGFLPLLQAQGEKLLKLELMEINDIGLDILSVLCPNLQELSLTYMIQAGNFPQNTHPELTRNAVFESKPFQNLEIILLAFYADSTITASALSTLLRGCVGLKELSLVGVEAFTDVFLKEILEQNPLTELEKLLLRECNEMSGGGLMELMVVPNKLRHLVLHYCTNVTRADYDGFLRLVHKHGYKMAIDWK